MNGEGLRGKQNPSVLDLAAKRIDQIDQWDAGSVWHFDRVASAWDMALELSEWDSGKAVPILKKQLNYCVGLYSDGLAADYGQSLLTRIAAMARAMAPAGDRSA